MQRRILEEKHAQAVSLLAEFEFDLWITYVRETSLQRDPALDLIYPHDVTWRSAFLISRAGDRIAIVGDFDVDNVERMALFTEVVGYREDLGPVLQEHVRRLQPDRLALNTSTNDPAADGLTAAMRAELLEQLGAAGITSDRVVSAESFLGSLRGRKSPSELIAIEAAIRRTEALYAEVGDQIHAGVSERELADFLQSRVDELGLGYAWDPHANPLVNTGPESIVGHAAPSDLLVRPGHLVHFDFGIRLDGYCSDLQRMWYVLAEGERKPPASVTEAWRAARDALLAGAEALRPGARGWEVDAAARAALQAHGYPEYQHAFGHHLGRFAHDGATILGPRWPRYGDSPQGLIEENNVFAIELGAEAEGHGWVSLEEDVRVTRDGVEWLSSPQEELRLVGI